MYASHFEPVLTSLRPYALAVTDEDEEDDTAAAGESAGSKRKADDDADGAEKRAK